jgi:glycosyltransferase involved in cell wall biosynthesis
MVGPKSFPPAIGGIETHVYEVSKTLASRGIEVSVIVPRAKGEAKEEVVEGVRVVRVPCISNSVTLKLSMIPFVLAELRRGTYDVVHAHDATGGFACALSARGSFVYTMHGLAFHPQDWPTPFRQGIEVMQGIALRRAMHVFCTDARAAEAIKGLRGNVEILSSGVDLKAFSGDGLKRPTEFSDDKFTFLFVGRLAKVKGIATLLKSIQSLPSEVRDQMKFVLIGDGPLMGDVRILERETRSVKALGPVNHSRIAPFYAHADAYILPSLSEGLPISLLEAMAAGLPAIASDVGGISSQIDTSTVRLVPPGDPEILAEAIVEIWTNKKLRENLGRKGQLFVSEHFTWDRVVDRLLEVYGRVRPSLTS